MNLKNISIGELDYLKLLLKIDIDETKDSLEEIVKDKQNNVKYFGRDSLYKKLYKQQGNKIDLFIKLDKIVNSNNFLSEKKKIVKKK